MKHLSLSLGFAAVLGLALVACNDVAPEPAPPLAAGLDDLRLASQVPIDVGVGDTGQVTTLRGRFELADTVAPLDGAREFLGRHAAAFGLRADLADLVLAREVHDVGGTTLAWTQTKGGIPVFEGELVVGLDPSGAVIHVSNHYLPDLGGVPSVARLTADDARTRAAASLGADPSALAAAPELVIVAGDKGAPGLHLAWQVSAFLREPLGDWRIFVDAITGDIVRTLDQRKSAGDACTPCTPGVTAGCGRVFRANPVEALNNPGVRDTNNVDGAQTGCLLGHLTSSTNLNGTYVNTGITGAPRDTAPWDSLRSASQPFADEVNLYYHVDRSKARLDALGFPSVMNFSIGSDAHDAALGDNSHYVPSQKIIEFGTGGVDDAQDADVVYHEYGHAIQDNQVPGYGTNHLAASAGEGFGDYWAAAITDDQAAAALGAGCVAAWDATAYNPYTGALGTGCLRRVDGTRQFPRDLAWEVHDDGEIWSAALWRMRGALGGAVADALVIKGHTFVTAGAEFINLADGVLSADQALNGGANAAAIHAAFKASGIPRSATPGTVTGTPQNVAFSCATAGSAYANNAYKECTFTQPGAAWVRFHFTRFNTEANFDYAYISDGDFRQVQRLSGTPFGAGGVGYSAVVNGPTIVLRFKADDSVTWPGFTIDQVNYGGVPQCSGDPQCSDGNACNGAEVCAAGTCVAGTPLACGDGNPCTADSCNPASGCVNAPLADGASCANGTVCDGAETCVGGACTGGAPLSCDDGDLCTADSCNAVTGCGAAPVTCQDDGNPCTAETCDPQTGACSSTPVADGTSCSDGDVCDGSNTCQAGACVDTGAPPSCDDGDPCTTDTCDAVGGCVHSGSCAPVTLASDGFESGNFSGGTGWLAAWTATGDTANITGSGPHAGTRHARLRTSTGFLSRRINLTGVTGAKLRFWGKLNGLDSGDTALVRVSTNGGSSYTTVRTFVNGEDDNAYHFYELDLSGFAMTANVAVAFDANMNQTNDQWYIDDVSVVGVP